MKENDDDDLEYHLEDPEEKTLNDKKCSPVIKVLFTILIILTILLSGVAAYLIYRYKDHKDFNDDKKSEKEKSNKEKNMPLEPDIHDSKIINFELNQGYPNWETFGIKISNLSYVKEDKIDNSFKEDGKNYIKEIGNINNGNDYKKNERNIYDLYIPYIATMKKNQNNKILLLIHGGYWAKGDKSLMDKLCKTYAKYGIITASMEYTLIDPTDYETNVFRILDEITATISSIKEYLIKENFDEKKLEFAIGGHSAGAHLSLLYAYLVKNIPCLIKFVLNLCGPVTMEPEYYIRLKENNEPLENLEQNYIDEGFKLNKTEYFNYLEDFKALALFNSFIGNKFSELELSTVLANKTINKESEIYKKMLNYLQYAFPFYYVNEKTIPTICLYSGKDSTIGIGHYALLKKKFEEKKNNNIIFIYSKYTDHNGYKEIKTFNGLKAMNKMHLEVLNLFKM